MVWTRCEDVMVLRQLDVKPLPYPTSLSQSSKVHAKRVKVVVRTREMTLAVVTCGTDLE